MSGKSRKFGRKFKNISDSEKIKVFLAVVKHPWYLCMYFYPMCVFLGSLHVWGNHGESASKAGLFKDTAGFVSTCKAKNSTPNCRGSIRRGADWKKMKMLKSGSVIKKGLENVFKITQNHQKLGQ